MAKQLETPIEQSGNKLNLIEICVDTWGTHFLGCYGNEWIKTPSVDRLASKSAVFEHCYPETLPTIPTRRVLYTGRRIFPTRQIAQPGDTVKISGWHQLYAEDITFAEMLTAAGYIPPHKFPTSITHSNRARTFTAAFNAGAGVAARKPTASNRDRKARSTCRSIRMPRASRPGACTNT